MIYEHRRYDISPAYRREFLDNFGKMLMPLFKKLEAEVIGVWETPIGDRNQLVCLLAFDDISKRMEFWENFEREEIYTKIAHLANAVTISILRPTPYSPMK